MIRNETVQYLIDDLEAAIKRASVIEPTLAASVARVVLEHLQQRHGGSKLYIPATSRQKLLAQFREAYVRGDPMRTTCKKLGISRRTFYYFLREIRSE